MMIFDQTFPSFKQQAVEAIDAAMTRAFKRFAPQLNLAEDRALLAAKHAVNAGGKRMRGMLVLCSSAICQPNQSHAREDTREDIEVDAKKETREDAWENALSVAASIELMHAYSLIHDDLPAMDNSHLRRGQPTPHIAFDEATAILAGDGLQALSFHILGSDLVHCDPVDVLSLVTELAQGAGFNGMVGGQMLDLLAESASDPFDLATTKRLQAKKTGALIRYSCKAGALMHGERGETLHQLDRFGARIGLSFQMVDDLLDVTASTDDIGKPVNADNKKATFIDLLGEQGTRNEIERLTAQAIEVAEFLRPSMGGSAQHAAINQLCHIAEFVAKRDH